jgi:cysteinyl-tRNA synthetase
MVLRLGELATVGARDPRETFRPYVETILELRRRAREGRDYATSDWLRDRLDVAGVEVRDTPDGTTWNVR